jgi:hypothetical protein
MKLTPNEKEFVEKWIDELKNNVVTFEKSIEETNKQIEFLEKLVR